MYKDCFEQKNSDKTGFWDNSDHTILAWNPISIYIYIYI